MGNSALEYLDAVLVEGATHRGPFHEFQLFDEYRHAQELGNQILSTIEWEGSRTWRAPSAFHAAAWFIWRLRTTEPLEGEWFEYHTTFVGQKQTTSSGVWTVRKGFFHKLVVEFQHETGGTLAYKGHLFEERGHVVVVLKSTSHATETVYYRFIDPIASERPIPGIWLSFDREGSICSGAAILSHASLEEPEVDSIFGNFFQRTARIPALRVDS